MNPGAVALPLACPAACPVPGFGGGGSVAATAVAGCGPVWAGQAAAAGGPLAAASRFSHSCWRLCAMAVIDSHAAFAVNTPDGI